MHKCNITGFVCVIIIVYTYLQYFYILPSNLKIALFDGFLAEACVGRSHRLSATIRFCL